MMKDKIIIKTITGRRVYGEDDNHENGCLFFNNRVEFRRRVNDTASHIHVYMKKKIGRKDEQAHTHLHTHQCTH